MVGCLRWILFLIFLFVFIFLAWLTSTFLLLPPRILVLQVLMVVADLFLGFLWRLMVTGWEVPSNTNRDHKLSAPWCPGSNKVFSSAKSKRRSRKIQVSVSSEAENTSAVGRNMSWAWTYPSRSSPGVWYIQGFGDTLLQYLVQERVSQKDGACYLAINKNRHHNDLQMFRRMVKSLIYKQLAIILADQAPPLSDVPKSSMSLYSQASAFSKRWKL